MNKIHQLYITADDLGLDPQINNGIAFCSKEKLIHGTAFLVNAPATEHALNNISDYKNIEIGLHLSLVEGYSLSGHKSLLDKKNYFPGDRPCLYQNWTLFAKDYLLGKIKLHELNDEFELQIKYFLKHVGPIPFLNGTQHLHMLPGVIGIIVELCKKYKIPRIRTSGISFAEVKFSKKKFISAAILNTCRTYSQFALSNSGIQSMGATFGITVSGQTDEKFMDFVYAESLKKKIELVIHPGYYSADLVKWIPENYSHFDWEKELKSLIHLRDKIHEP